MPVSTRKMSVENDKKQAASSLWLVILFVFVDVLGFSLILPFLPYLKEQFSSSPTRVALLASANALTQMLAAPMIGRLSDRYGRRPLILLCLSGSVLSFVLLGMARSFELALFSRILDGLLGGNISLAQAYVTDITDSADSNRARSLGLINAAFGIGFTVGPGLGAWLIGHGSHWPAFGAAALCAVNLIGVFLWLPESKKKQATTTADSTHRALSPSLLDVLSKMMTGGTLAWLLILRFLWGFVFTSVIETSFSYINKDELGLNGRQSGYFLCFFALCYAGTQSRLGPMLRRMPNEWKLASAAAALCALSLCALSFVWTVWSAAIAYAGYAAGAGIFNTLIYSQLSKQVEHAAIGTALGLSASVGSLTRVVAPIVSGIVIESFGSRAAPLLGSLLMLISIFILLRMARREVVAKRPKKK